MNKCENVIQCACGECGLEEKIPDSNCCVVHKRYTKQCYSHFNNVITMHLELMDGTLSDYLEKKPVRKEQLECLRQIATGLKHLHNHNIMHRDLKPRNILYKYDGFNYTFKIADFGLSLCSYHCTKIETEYDADIDYGKYKHTYGMCTVLYRAPEIFKAQQKAKCSYDLSVDIWSFGCVAFDVFYFQNLFPVSADTTEQLDINILNDIKYLCEQVEITNANVNFRFCGIREWIKKCKILNGCLKFHSHERKKIDGVLKDIQNAIHGPKNVKRHRKN